MNKLTANPLLAVMPPDTASKERVPAVMDFNFRPDMGTMTGRLPSIARTPYRRLGRRRRALGGNRFADRNLQAHRRRAARLLADVITRIVNGRSQTRLDDLMPWAYPAVPRLQDVATERRLRSFERA